jgi:hypothetical protein
MPYPLVTHVLIGIIPVTAHSAIGVNPAGWLVSAVPTTAARLDSEPSIVAIVSPDGDGAVVSVDPADAGVAAETVDSCVGSPAVSAPVGASDWHAVPRAARSTGRLSATRQR